MKTPIQIPSLGLVEVVTLVSWAHPDGARVTEGETIAEVETEKSLVEIESPSSGILKIAIEVSPDLIPSEAVLGHVDDEA